MPRVGLLFGKVLNSYQNGTVSRTAMRSKPMCPYAPSGSTNGLGLSSWLRTGQGPDSRTWREGDNRDPDKAGATHRRMPFS